MQQRQPIQKRNTRGAIAKGVEPAAPEYDFLYKLLLVGSAGVGKSCLLSRFAEDRFTEDYISTIGVDFKIRTLVREGHTCRVQVWDTAGQERFKTSPSYYRGAHGIIIVYDATARHTFEMAGDWLAEARQYCTDHVSLLLVGNKYDSPAVAVSEDEGRQLAMDMNMMFVATSARHGDFVEYGFNKLVTEIYARNKPQGFVVLSVSIRQDALGTTMLLKSMAGEDACKVTIEQNEEHSTTLWSIWPLITEQMGTERFRILLQDRRIIETASAKGAAVAEFLRISDLKWLADDVSIALPSDYSRQVTPESDSLRLTSEMSHW